MPLKVLVAAQIFVVAAVAENRVIRFVVGVVGGLVLLTGVLSLGERVTAQTSLPLGNLGIEHLDIVVPDPAASARFYARIFRTTRTVTMESSSQAPASASPRSG